MITRAVALAAAMSAMTLALTLTLTLTWGQAALANEKPTALRRMSCTVVRFYVAKYSEAAAESWARSRGASDAEIETARRCLGSSVQTASFAGK
jgi:hypothetical protein